MRVIGVRELKATLSETLRAVENGEQVRITLRGRPVADIVPAGADERLSALVTEGRIVPASRARPKRAPRALKAETLASDLVLSEREDER
jgi:prevent-host-death family protein